MEGESSSKQKKPKEAKGKKLSKQKTKITKQPIAPLPPTPPQVYDVDRMNFRDVVQQLTGAPEFQSQVQRHAPILTPPSLHYPTPVFPGTDTTTFQEHPQLAASPSLHYTTPAFPGTSTTIFQQHPEVPASPSLYYTDTTPTLPGSGTEISGEEFIPPVADADEEAFMPHTSQD